MSARTVILLLLCATSVTYAIQPDPIYRETELRHSRPLAAGERYDAQEDDPKLRDAFAAADAAAERRVGNVKRDDRFIFAFWAEKKAILRDKYQIEWKTPAELNPQITYISYGQRKVSEQEIAEITAVVKQRTKRHITHIDRDPKGVVRVWFPAEGNEAMVYIVEKQGNGWKIALEDKAIFD
jgi:hypothetical protein